MALRAGRKGVKNAQIDAYGNLLVDVVAEIPIADADTVGGVKPVSKTTGMTQDVGIDSAGKLYTEPAAALQVATAETLGGVKPVSKTAGMTQDVGIDSDGKLYTEPGSGGGGGGDIYYKDFTSFSTISGNWKKTSDNVNVSGYKPISCAIGNTGTGYIGYGGCVYISGFGSTEDYYAAGYFNNDSNMRCRVFYVKDENYKQIPTT